MGSSDYSIRRATLDDLDTLRGLWRESRLPEYDLDKRFTEFQIAIDNHGWILGALAARFSGQHGEVHSLAIRRADQEAELRDALWERILQIAHQQGTLRLWNRHSGDFWTDRGFTPAPAAALKELPSTFGPPGESWRTLKLRDEPLKLIAAEEQLDAFLDMERLKTDRLVSQARALKIVAVSFIALIFVGVAAALLVLLSRNRKARPRQP